MIRLPPVSTRPDTLFSYTTLCRVPADYPPGRLVSIAGGGDILIGGRYIDRFERRDGVWRIAHRTGLLDWRQDTKADDGQLSQTPLEWRGRYGADDPSLPVVETLL